jgi:hypothetical protein
MNARQLLLAFPLILASAALAQTPAQIHGGTRHPHKQGDYTAQDHNRMHEPPKGTGAAPDGGAWLRVDVDGVYTIHNGYILDFAPRRKNLQLVGQRYYRVLPHRGALIWTRADGVRERVPKDNLLPAVTVKPLMEKLYQRRPELKVTPTDAVPRAVPE